MRDKLLLNKKTILHIDDDRDFIQLFRLFMESDYFIISEDHTDSAMQIATENHVDLILLDHEMPEMNGIEFLKRLRRINNDIPVIFYTGQGNEAIAREAFLEGAVDYFTKEVTEFAHREKLKNAINNAIKIKETEQSRRDSENNYKLLFNKMVQGFALHSVITDDNGKPVDYRFLSINPAFEKLTGLKGADIIGKTARQILPEIEDSWIDRYGKVALEGDAICFEDYSIALNKYFEVNAYQTRPGRFATIFSEIFKNKYVSSEKDSPVILSPGEWRKLQMKIKEKQEQLLSILDGMDEVVYVADPYTYELLYMNKPAVMLFGNCIGKKCHKSLQNLDEPCPFCTNQILFEGERTAPFIWEFQNTVTKRWYRCIDKAINWSENRKARFEIAIDITDSKELEEELLNKNRELTDFSHRVSHDLKGPVNILRAITQEIYEDRSLFDEYYPIIIEKTDRILEFIDKLLSLSRAGRIIDSKTMVNVKNMITRLFITLRPEKNCCDLIIDEDMPQVLGDPGSLEEVFINLLQNSFKYRNPDERELVIEVRSQADEDFTTITYKDNGTGVCPEVLEKIFTPGFSLAKNKGTGFGLAIIKKIIKAHGGKISASSRGINSGLEFEMTFPNSESGPD